MLTVSSWGSYDAQLLLYMVLIASKRMFISNTNVSELTDIQGCSYGITMQIMQLESFEIIKQNEKVLSQQLIENFWTSIPLRWNTIGIENVISAIDEFEKSIHMWAGECICNMHHKKYASGNMYRKRIGWADSNNLQDSNLLSKLLVSI